MIQGEEIECNCFTKVLRTKVISIWFGKKEVKKVSRHMMVLVVRLLDSFEEKNKFVVRKIILVNEVPFLCYW